MWEGTLRTTTVALILVIAMCPLADGCGAVAYTDAAGEPHCEAKGKESNFALFSLQGVSYSSGAAVFNVLYFPTKLVFAAFVGGLVGTTEFLLGNPDEAQDSWRAGLGGDYVLTPAMVAKNKPVYFLGGNPGCL